jgi:hypothetical protein
MDDMSIVIIMRALERLIVLVGGILAIWMGYKLFALVPQYRDSEGKIDLPGGVSIFVTRVGPGVFFALFGTGLMGYSATRPISYSLENRAGRGNVTIADYNAISDGTQNSELAAEVVGVPPGSPDRQNIIRYLNAWYSEIPDNVDGSTRQNITIAVREAKLALMRENWSTAKWGDYRFFHKWALEKGGTGDTAGVPAITQVAVEVYKGGAK